MSLRQSRLIVECPHCHATYTDATVTLVREEGERRLFHCACPSCKRSMIALIRDHEGWISTMGLVTDLDAADAVRLAAQTPVAADECIRAYQYISQQSQNLCQDLLKRAS
jgi:hypothetical protein